MEIKPYTVTLWDSARGVERTHRVDAYNAEDAWFQTQKNICDKEQVLRNGKWEPVARIYSVAPYVN